MRGYAIVIWLVVCACSPSHHADAPIAPADPSRMSHERHAQIACIGCHRTTLGAATLTARPGLDDHRPCDDAKCHATEFVKPPGQFCKVCHVEVTTNPVTAKLKPYPAEDVWQAMPPRFSHKVHLDRGKLEGRVGFHVSCADCHVRANGALAPPDHETCARCHAAEAGLIGAPRMDACVGCHTTGVQERRRRRLITDDLKFDHDRHQIDRRGTPIKCEDCHTQSGVATDAASHAPPRIEACVGCHDDSVRTPDANRMRACETCHTTKTGKLTALAPRNHLPLTERPIDHTIAFRRDHAEAATHNTARCATCHTQMSGNPEQACDECHQTMKPADHRITFRELDHGPDAVADRDRCASCHVVEFCNACHAQRPRSHGFAFFSDHKELARINIRSCLTCHGDAYCNNCHQGSAATPRRLK